MTPPHVMSRRRFWIVPRASIKLSGPSSVQIAYFACSNMLYQVEWSDDLSGTNWWPVTDPVPGDATAKYIDQSIDGFAQKFYRILTLTP